MYEIIIRIISAKPAGVSTRRVLIKHETIIISRKGKPVAHLTPIPSDSCQDDASRFPLRGISISIAEDFDEPVPGLWEALEQ